MGANDLILHLRESGFSLTLKDDRLQIAPADKLTDELKNTIKQSKPELLNELQRETRRKEVIAILEAAPDMQRAIYADTESDPHNVIVTVAVRCCQQTCDLLIPKSKYDPWRLLDLIGQYGQTTH